MCHPPASEYDTVHRIKARHKLPLQGQSNVHIIFYVEQFYDLFLVPTFIAINAHRIELTGSQPTCRIVKDSLRNTKDSKILFCV